LKIGSSSPVPFLLAPAFFREYSQNDQSIKSEVIFLPLKIGSRKSGDHSRSPAFLIDAKKACVENDNKCLEVIRLRI
jgi:hypothetical protein